MPELLECISGRKSGQLKLLSGLSSRPVGLVGKELQRFELRLARKAGIGGRQS